MYLERTNMKYEDKLYSYFIFIQFIIENGALRRECRSYYWWQIKTEHFIKWPLPLLKELFISWKFTVDLNRGEDKRSLKRKMGNWAENRWWNWRDTKEEWRWMKYEKERGSGIERGPECKVSSVIAVAAPEMKTRWATGGHYCVTLATRHWMRGFGGVAINLDGFLPNIFLHKPSWISKPPFALPSPSLVLTSLLTSRSSILTSLGKKKGFFDR